MPQIPVINGGQRLEPGSPVAVGSAENSADGIAARGVADMGSALLAFGNKLDEVAKRAKDKNKELDVQIALNELDRSARSAQIAFAARSMQEGDASGGKTVFDYEEYVGELKGGIADRLEDPEAKKIFEARSGAIAKEYATKVYAEEVKKIAEQVPVKMQNILTNFVDLAYNDHTQSTFSALKGEEMIRANKDVAERDVEAEVVKFRTTVLTSGAQGLLEQAKDPNLNYLQAQAKFNEARAFIQANTKLLTDKGRTDILETIDKEQKQFTDFDWTKSQRIDSITENRKKALREAARSAYTKEIAMVENNDHAFTEVMARAVMDPNLKPEDINELQKSQVFKKTRDDAYQQKFISDLIQSPKPDYRKADKQLEKDFNAGKLSQDRQIDLQKMMQNMRESDARNPMLRDVIEETKKRVKGSFNMYKPDPLRPGETVEVFNAQGLVATQNFLSAVAREYNAGQPPSVDRVRALGESFMGSPTLKNIRGLETGQAADLKGLAETKKAIAEDFAKNGKNWTPKQKEQKLKQLRDINENIRRQNEFEKIKVQKPDIFKNNSDKVRDE